MKIALIGYGKMGRTIEETALLHQHEIVLKIDVANRNDFTKQNISKADVAIEFTTPDSAFENVMKCIEFGVPVVSGSTGWNHKIEEAKNFCNKQNGSFLYTSNFSIGVNIFFEVHKLLASLMALHPEYEVTIKEIHHTQKKDAPSGTAVTLAEQILAHLPQKKSWTNNETSKGEEISIISERIDPAAGIHEVKYSSEVDNIEIIHTAHSRKGFALGAVLAAEFIADQKGIFTMQDVLRLKAE